MGYRYLSLFFIFFFTKNIFAEPVAQRPTSASLGLDYVLLSGDLRDYFRNDLSYNFNMTHELDFDIANFLLSETLSYSSLSSDDINERSKLHWISAAVGLGQVFLSNSWLAWQGVLAPEFSYWYLRNNLSSSFAHVDKGFLWGASLESKLVFDIMTIFQVDFVLALHTPEMIMHNTFLTLGWRIGKTW